MNSINLFNAVLVDKSKITKNLLLSETLPFGFILQPEVAASKNVREVINYLVEQSLTGEKLNKTFHKSWAKIQDSSREELLAHQLLHYFSTYGLESLGLYSEDTIYIPKEVLEIPEIENLPLKVIKGLSKEELIAKCLGLFESGIALKIETIDAVLSLLDELGYTFTSVDNIKNKEAKLKICVKNNIYPANNVEIIRLLVFKATGSILLIKDNDTIEAIKNSKLDISDLTNLEYISEVFLRFKPLFLAFKQANHKNIAVVNKLRKLSKSNHVPIKEDYLNSVTYLPLDVQRLNKELNTVNNFRKIRLLYALSIRDTETKSLIYKIRNGKTFTKDKAYKPNNDLKFNYTYSNFIEGLNLKGKKIKYPSDLDYALPTTEKQFIGNFPTGTTVELDSDMLVGIYWENSWGARDLDLSMISLEGKTGWNSNYRNGSSTVLFSGDMTQAPNGATELFYIKKELDSPSMLVNNTFSGEENSKFNIIVGKETVKNLSKNYMMNPNNKILKVESFMNQKQKNLGLVIPTKEGNKFVLTDFSTGSARVSSVSDLEKKKQDYLLNFYDNVISLKSVLTDAGVEFVEEGFDIDLSPENLEKDTILKLFI